MLVSFRNSPLNWYHLGRVEPKYALRILSGKSLELAMDATHQEKEILTSEWISKLEPMSVSHVELKWLSARAARLTATCN